MGNQIFDEKYPNVVSRKVTSADSTDPLGLNYSINNLAYRVDALLVASTAAEDHLMGVYIGDPQSFSPPYPDILFVNIPAGAGNGTVPLVDVLAAFPLALQGGIAFFHEQGFSVHLVEALGAGETMSIAIIGGDL